MFLLLFVDLSYCTIISSGVAHSIETHLNTQSELATVSQCKLFRISIRFIMKVFQSIQKYFSTELGIQSPQWPQKFSYNVKNFTILVLLTVDLIFCIIFLFWEAKNFKEGADCIFVIITLIAVGFEYVIYCWKIKQMFEFIKHFEAVILQSESKEISILATS